MKRLDNDREEKEIKVMNEEVSEMEHVPLLNSQALSHYQRIMQTKILKHTIIAEHAVYFW